MYWTGLNPNDVPVRDVISFTQHFEDMAEEHRDMLESAVAKGVAEVLNKL